MYFLDAVKILRANDTSVEYSTLYNERGRFYRVLEESSDLPPIWMSVRAITTLAELDNLYR